MDRQIVYIGAIPQDTDLLLTNKNTMIALAMLAQAVLGTSTSYDGLAVAPTSPASLAVNVGQGSIYQLENVDGTAYGSLAADTTDTIVKQGVQIGTVSLNTPAPGTAGFSINYLIEAQYQDSDTGAAVLPYYNASNPSQAWSGPNGTGQSQNTVRKGIVALQAKAGIAATTGTQTTPSPDSGYVGIAVVTVANGQATVTSGNITSYTGTPAITPKLTGITAAIQAQAGNYATDSGTANAYACTLTPGLAQHQAGMPIRLKIANSNTGASTFNPGPGAVSIVHPDGSALDGGDMPAGAIATLVYDGAHYQLLDILRIPPLPNGFGGQCKVVVNSSTQLLVSPLNGDYFCVNGKLYRIPSAGITIANTNVEVSGVAGQSLAVSTDYLLYLKDNGSGTLIGSFYPIAGGHMTDTTAGNVGVEVRSNSGTPDSTRSLIAMVGTDGSGNFSDTGATRLLANWFPNARRDKVAAASVSAVNITQTSSALLSASLNVVMMTWGDEVTKGSFDGYFANNTVSAVSAIQCAADGAAIGSLVEEAEPNANALFGMSSTFNAAFAETRHTVSPFGNVTSGTMTMEQVYNRVFYRG